MVHVKVDVMQIEFDFMDRCPDSFLSNSLIQGFVLFSFSIVFSFVEHLPQFCSTKKMIIFPFYHESERCVCNFYLIRDLFIIFYIFIIWCFALNCCVRPPNRETRTE